MTLELQLQCQTPWNRKHESKTISSFSISLGEHSANDAVLRAHNCYCCITARLFSFFFQFYAVVAVLVVAIVVVVVFLLFFFIFNLSCFFFPRNLQLLLMFALLKMKVAISVKLCVMNCLGVTTNLFKPILSYGISLGVLHRFVDRFAISICMLLIKNLFWWKWVEIHFKEKWFIPRTFMT